MVHPWPTVFLFLRLLLGDFIHILGCYCPPYTHGCYMISKWACSLTLRLLSNCLLVTSTWMSCRHLKFSSPKLKIPVPNLCQLEIPPWVQLSSLEIWGLFLILFPTPTPNRTVLPSKTVPEFSPPFPLPHTCVQPSSIGWDSLLVPVLSPYTQLFFQSPEALS